MSEKLVQLRLNNLKNTTRAAASLTRRFYRDPDLDDSSLGWHRVLQGYLKLLGDFHREAEIVERLDKIELILRDRKLM